MMIDSITREAIAKCLALDIPFALCLLPDSDESTFFAAAPAADNCDLTVIGEAIDRFDGFLFSDFEVNQTIRATGITKILTAADILSLDAHAAICSDVVLRRLNETTTREAYYEQADRIIGSFGSDKEKAVLSKVTAIKSEVHPVDVAERYFAQHPSCFRYLYFTPECGIWFGASPELVLDYDCNTGKFISMSLAGTRAVADFDSVWDTKNSLEHDMVTDYILDVLHRHGFATGDPEMKNVRFGHIEHLCHIIGACGNEKLSRLLPDLYPTPAFCGFPRDAAWQLIRTVETHRRYCYGGFAGIKSGGRTRLYVNMRCAFTHKADKDGRFTYNLFGGGGLTCRSDREAEWMEAEAKVSSLKQIITQN